MRALIQVGFTTILLFVEPYWHTRVVAKVHLTVREVPFQLVQEAKQIPITVKEVKKDAIIEEQREVILVGGLCLWHLILGTDKWYRSLLIGT